MSEEKTGTQLVRDMCQTFRDVAETTQFDAVKEKLISLADDLEPLDKKLYFKTQKGTEDMEELTKEFEAMQSRWLHARKRAQPKRFVLHFTTN